MFMSRARFWASLLVAGLATTLPAAAAQGETSPAEAGEAASAEINVEEATDFAREMTADATTALTAPGTTEAQRLSAFQDVLAESLALDVIGRFMLGDNRKSMSAEQTARYEAVFPLYMTRQYAEQFEDIVGRPLEVVDSKKLGERDAIVRTRFTREQGSPIMVDWRVRKLRSGDLKMIDIIVSGVSIMLVKREEFSSFIARNGVDALLDRIEAEAQGA